MIIFILGIICVALVVVIYIQQVKLNNLQNYADECKTRKLFYQNRISMVEYFHREYREGGNAYRVLAKIGDVLQGYTAKQIKYDREKYE